MLFPFIGSLAAAEPGATIVVPFGTVQNPIRMMEMEHEAVGSLLARLFDELEADLAPHMMKEERVLFPFIATMAAASPGTASVVPFGTVQNPIRVMEMEHEAVGGLLARMRALTNGFEPPADACNTFRGLYHAFVEIERDTHEHIHVENNVLHPRAIARETELLSSSIA